MIEYEILVIMVLASGLCFILGSWFSPMNKTLKKEVQYWRGISGKYKAEMNETKKDGLDDILGSSPLGKLATPIVKDFLSNPEKIQGLLDKLGVKLPSTDKNNQSDYFGR